MVMSQNWTSEFSRSFKKLTDLYSFLEWDIDSSLLKVAETYPVFIPVSLAEKIKSQGPTGALAKEFMPNLLEINADLNHKGLEDPIGDKEYFKAPQLIHRYETRALFTPTSVCPVQCRYCFRKNELDASDELFQQDFQETLNYLKNNPQISEIIFTGGDPLTLSNDKIEKYLDAFSKIPSIKDIRFHSRYPVILPERIDSVLCDILGKFSEVFRTISIAIHVNHISEFDETNRRAIKRLSSINIQLLSQTVLLRGVNDSAEALIDLFTEFMNLKIRAYYLHHPDRVKGGMHFYMSLEAGRELYQMIRKALPGWAIPQYVIDIPGGHGKVPAFNPETYSFSGSLLTKDGGQASIPEIISYRS